MKRYFLGSAFSAIAMSIMAPAHVPLLPSFPLFRAGGDYGGASAARSRGGSVAQDRRHAKKRAAVKRARRLGHA